VPQLNPIFRTTPLPPFELALCLAASSVVFIAVEVHKWTVRRSRRNATRYHHATP
jgi:Ca2+-transporting ATPase